MERFLGGELIYRSGIRYFMDPKGLGKFVGNTPGALGLGTTSIDLTDVNVPAHEPLIRDLEMVYLGDPSPGVKLLQTYIAKHPIGD